MKPKGIAHLGIAVRNIDAALSFWRDALGLEHESTKELPERGLRVAFLRAGETLVELLEPLHERSEISTFLDKRGEGIHHVCFEVDDIRAKIADVQSKGVRMVSPEPSIGAEGLPVAFMHPKSCNGVLAELLESAPAP